MVEWLIVNNKFNISLISWKNGLLCPKIPEFLKQSIMLNCAQIMPSIISSDLVVAKLINPISYHDSNVTCKAFCNWKCL